MTYLLTYLQRSGTNHGEQKTTWNGLQRARHNLQRPEPTNNEQKLTQNHQHQADFKIILQNGSIGYFLQHVFYPTFDYNHSSIAAWRIMVKIECQRFVYYHVYLLRDMTFTGYVASHFDTRKFKFARQKSTLWI